MGFLEPSKGDHVSSSLAGKTFKHGCIRRLPWENLLEKAHV